MLVFRSLNIEQRKCAGLVLEHLNNTVALEGHQKCVNKMAIDDFWLADLPEHSPPLHQQPDHIRRRIKKAFGGVELEDGTSLHETIYHDNYGMVSQKVLRQMEEDERFNWEKLLDDPELYLVSGIGGISFYDEKGFRFHLPAYMCLGLIHDGLDIIQELVFTLASQDSRRQDMLMVLNKDQRHCATLFLKYLRDTSIHFPPGMLPDINAALCEFWCAA